MSMVNQKSRKYAFKALLTVCITSFCASGISWATISLYAAPIVKDFGITATQFMFVLTLLVIINAFSSIALYGTIISKLGIRRSVIAGMVLLVTAQAIWAFSNGLVMLYLGAVVMGLGIVTITANTQVLVLNAWYNKKAGTYIGIANTIGSVSGMICAAIYGNLIIAVGWRIPFLITCGFDALGLILVVIYFKGLPEEVGVEALYTEEQSTEKSESKEKETGLGLVDMIKTPKFYFLAVTYFLVGSLGYGTMGNLALLLTETGRGELSGTAVSVTMLGSAATMTLCGYMCDKVGSKWFVCLAMLMAGVATMILRNPNINVVLIYLAAAFIGVAYNATQFTAGLLTKEIYGTKEYDKKVGIIHGVNLFGLGFGPAILQMIKSSVGTYETTLIIFSIAAIIAIILIIIVANPDKSIKEEANI